jgi:hypothetical protein
MSQFQMSCHNVEYVRQDYQLKVCTGNVNILGGTGTQGALQPF